MPWPSRLLLFGRCLLAGLCIAASVPPWGWWPLAFVGIALLDRLIADQPWKRRFRRTWLVAAAWLFPALFWIWDLTDRILQRTLRTAYPEGISGLAITQLGDGNDIALTGGPKADLKTWDLTSGAMISSARTSGSSSIQHASAASTRSRPRKTAK